jgi:hypothetical protein
MISSIIIFTHGYISIKTSNLNLLYIFRYFLVWILIFVTSYVWFFYEGNILVAPFGEEYQNLENTRILVSAGIFSLCGSLIGWHSGLLNFNYQKYPKFRITNNHKKVFSIVGIFISFTLALAYVYKSGGFINNESTYSNREEGFSWTFGVFNIFHFIGISLILIGGMQYSNIRLTNIFLALASLLIGILTGSRADFLPQAFIIFLLIFNARLVGTLKTKNFFYFFKWLIFLVIILFIAYCVSLYIGYWRAGLNIYDAYNLLWNNDEGFLIKNNSENKMAYLETGNMMLGGFYSAIVNVKELLQIDNYDGHSGFLLGKSYINYFLTLPPALFGFERPLGLEWATSINNIQMSQGGIFEVAEAYWNFGYVGCFFVSFFISYIFSLLLKRGLKKSNYFFLTWYIVFGLHGFRCIWYQNFSYLRIATVMIIVYILAYFLFRFFIVDNYVLKISSKSR